VPQKKLLNQGHVASSQKFRLRILSSPFFVLVALLAVSPAVRCQTPPLPQASLQGGNNEFGIWASYAPGSPHVIGITSPRQFAVLGFRYGRILFDKPKWSLEYTLDVSPVEIMLQPKILGSFINSGGNVTYITGSREVVYGGGVNPIGLKLNFLRRRRFQFFGASTTGFVASVRPIPVDVHGETQFNFDFDFQAGFQLYNSSRKRAWMFGYKYQHISNAYRGQINPGVDLNTVFVGYSFYK
jgi:Lipid A 3-O-deacylase (PagL)